MQDMDVLLTYFEVSLKEILHFLCISHAPSDVLVFICAVVVVDPNYESSSTGFARVRR